MAAKWGTNVLFFMPNRTKCILLASPQPRRDEHTRSDKRCPDLTRPNPLDAVPKLNARPHTPDH
jgi:hypothetical protein